MSRPRTVVVVAAVTAWVLLGGTACSGDDDGPAASTTTIPRPAGPSSGVLQFRMIEEGEPMNCGALPATPSPQEKYAVIGGGNQCVQLGVAEVVIGRGELRFDENAPRPALELVLSDVDTAQLASFAQRQKGKAIAVVGLGRVLFTVPLPEKIEGGRITLPPLNRNDALRLRAALA